MRNLTKVGIQWVHLDLQDFEKIRSVVGRSQADAVFHPAAQSYAQKAWNHPLDTFRTNVMGTIALYKELRKDPPKAGVLLSASASAYGITKELPIREAFPQNPTNPYGVSKDCQEMPTLQYSLNFDLRIVRARLSGTTGPGMTGDALNDFAQQIASFERAGSPES